MNWNENKIYIIPVSYSDLEHSRTTYTSSSAKVALKLLEGQWYHAHTSLNTTKSLVVCESCDPKYFRRGDKF